MVHFFYRVKYISRRYGLSLTFVITGKFVDCTEMNTSFIHMIIFQQTVLTAEELIFFDKVKEFLGSSVNERMLVQAIKVCS